MTTAYFVPLAPESPDPDYFKGCYPSLREYSGHTLSGSLEDYMAWRKTLPVGVASLDPFFRVSLIAHPAWDAWAESLPHHRYSNLIAAAIVGSWAEAQAIYDLIKISNPPSNEAAAAWQTLADMYEIDLNF